MVGLQISLLTQFCILLPLRDQIQGCKQLRSEVCYVSVYMICKGVISNTHI